MATTYVNSTGPMQTAFTSLPFTTLNLSSFEVVHDVLLNLSLAQIVTTTVFGLLVLTFFWLKNRFLVGATQKDKDTLPPLLECIPARRSVFPRSYITGSVSPQMMSRLLEAAMWAPYHGPVPPWRFVVLGREAMIDMQKVTLAFYDEHWREAGKHGSKEEYDTWRQKTEDDIHGRWEPVSYMVGIVMRRQAGSKRLPEWEELAATACAVQNMHLQASVMGLACYWSSWHAAARDSQAMSEFLGMEKEDRCLGFFIVATCEQSLMTRKRSRRPESHLSAEWRP